MFRRNPLKLGISATSLLTGGFVLGLGLVISQHYHRPIETRHISRENLSNHSSIENGGIWVSRGNKVYDITSFVKDHPGGYDKIMLAAGRSIDPFWNIFTIHKSPHIEKLLETMEIGTLDPNDVATLDRSEDDKLALLFSNEPFRNPNLIVRSQFPFNGETPLSVLATDGFTTSNNNFYIRNHLPVPSTDNKYPYTIEINADDNVTHITLNHLKTLTQKEITATLQCAGNKRNAFNKETQGLQWTAGAIGNAQWKGIPIRTVLENAFGDDINRITNSFSHVELCGKDGYCASVPMDKAMHDDSILALEMSGEALPLDHGNPVRAIIPGVVAARSVKWLCSINLLHEESSSYWQRKDYKIFSKEFDGKEKIPTDLQCENTASIQDTPVQSAILAIIDENEKRVISGYAFSGGGREIVSVEVSTDDGETWEKAVLNGDGKWAWKTWNAYLPYQKGVSNVVCRATDSCGNVQQREAKWNYRGLINNSWGQLF